VKAVQVPPAKTAAAWPYVEHWVKAALARGSDHAPHDVRAMCDRGAMQMWLAWNGKPVGVCLTEIILSARGRCCNIVAVAGEGFDTWRHLEADVAHWAREHWGCVRLTLVGRRGWVRQLRPEWRQTLVVMEREL
jgi:hypothetical protein